MATCFFFLAATETDEWREVFFGLEPRERFPLLIIAIGCTFALLLTTVIVVGNVVYSIQRRRSEYDLKRDMLDRGLSADEISEIIKATPPPEGAVDQWIASWGDKKKQ